MSIPPDIRKPLSSTALKIRPYSLSVVYGILGGLAVSQVILMINHPENKNTILTNLLPCAIVPVIPWLIAKNATRKGYPPIPFKPASFIVTSLLVVLMIYGADLLKR